MKNIFKSIFAIGAVVAFAVSCNVDNVGTKYEFADGESCVSFPKSVAGDTEVNAKATTFSIPIVRGRADGDLTVNLATTLPEGVTVPSTVSFSAGEYETEIKLDIASMEVGKTYKGNITLANEDQFDKNTAISSIAVTLAKAYTWVEIGKGQFYDPIALQVSAKDLGIVEVSFLQAEGFNRWRMLEPFPKAQLYKAWGEAYVTYAPDSVIEFFADENGQISFTASVFKTGLTYVDLADNAYIWYYLPSKYSSSYAANDADSKFVMDKVAQFCWVGNIENTNYWMNLQYMYVSLPGGPDLNTLLQ